MLGICAEISGPSIETWTLTNKQKSVNAINTFYCKPVFRFEMQREMCTISIHAGFVLINQWVSSHNLKKTGVMIAEWHIHQEFLISTAFLNLLRKDSGGNAFWTCTLVRQSYINTAVGSSLHLCVGVDPIPPEWKVSNSGDQVSLRLQSPTICASFPCTVESPSFNFLCWISCVL